MRDTREPDDDDSPLHADRRACRRVHDFDVGHNIQAESLRGDYERSRGVRVEPLQQPQVVVDERVNGLVGSARLSTVQSEGLRPLPE